MLMLMLMLMLILMLMLMLMCVNVNVTGNNVLALKGARLYCSKNCRVWPALFLPLSTLLRLFYCL